MYRCPQGSQSSVVQRGNESRRTRCTKQNCCLPPSVCPAASRSRSSSGRRRSSSAGLGCSRQRVNKPQVLTTRQRPSRLGGRLVLAAERLGRLIVVGDGVFQLLLKLLQQRWMPLMPFCQRRSVAAAATALQHRPPTAHARTRHSMHTCALPPPPPTFAAD